MIRLAIGTVNWVDDLLAKNVSNAETLSMPAGYSGTPLAKKLGIKAGNRVAVVNEPADFRELLADLPDETKFQDNLRGKPNVVVAFHTEAKNLRKGLPALGKAIFPDRMLWLAWPKKTSGMDSDLTGDVVRGIVLATDHLVDVKVCAISETWSGLKIVVRKTHR